MAKLEWDHTVHYVKQLNTAMKTFLANGLIAFHGGSHKKWGTCNALSYFDLCYIEFLSIEDRNLARSILDPNDVVKDAVKLLPEREIFSRVALRTDDIEAIANRLDAKNISHSPIMDGKRTDAQGNLIEWYMMTIPGDFHALPYPFIIQWKCAEDVRRKQLQDIGAIGKHPIGNIAINQAIFEVENPRDVVEHWHDIFGIDILNITTDEAKLLIGDKIFLFKKGPTNQLRKLAFKLHGLQLLDHTFKIGEGRYQISTKK
ncbi:hypothetical protein Pryu01_00741 [Paraliobacillus ryukyuensis]|uniref:Glyoxalase-like protein n=1 Tax=Paraliobacillus ryukyuensis TaxID=200904 RepID=A0A366EF87_9BACI|nr:VOC family protein [Paraliobacillus ryukyuensis]RBP00686.1 glyoxalase-like protein [Paraliobacillus ryukyuensis]